jgi:hypothetical protein
MNEPLEKEITNNLNPLSSSSNCYRISVLKQYVNISSPILQNVCLNDARLVLRTTVFFSKSEPEYSGREITDIKTSEDYETLHEVH